MIVTNRASTRLLRTAILLSSIAVGFAYKAEAQVDARRELEKVKQGYQQLLADEREYNENTQQHLDKTIAHVLEKLSFGYLEARFGKDAASFSHDLYDLKKNIDAGGAGNTREQAEILIEQMIGKIADRTGVGELPAIVDTVFDFLYLHEDLKQRQNLDAWRAALDKQREYWTKYAEGHPWGNPPDTAQPTTDLRDAEFLRAISKLGIRIMMPHEAVKQGAARISGEARQGYSRADVEIVSAVDNWLALDFSGAYLIPKSDDSNSQRLGLVSVVESEAASRQLGTSLRSGLPAVFYGFNSPFVSVGYLQTKSASFSNGHWVLVAPRARVVISFNTVCLDHSRGIPGQGERFYMSDQALPFRIQKILVTASLNNTIPQNQVWSVIEAEHIKWWDPRVGPTAILARARRSFENGQFDAVIEGCAEVLSTDPNNAEAILLTGLSYYDLGISDTNREHAIQMYSESYKYLTRALDLNQEVNLPVKHHHAVGLDQDLCAGYLVLSRDRFKFHSTTLDGHDFDVPLSKIYELKLEPEKAGRLHTRIGIQKEKKEDKQNYNFQSAEVKIIRQTVWLTPTAPFSRNEIYCTVACTPGMQVIFSLLQNLIPHPSAAASSAENHFNQAQDLAKTGKWAKVESECRKAMEIDPKNVTYDECVGIALMQQRKWIEAEAVFRNALKFQPNVAELHLNLGLALSAQQKQSEVESEYREALRLEPDNALVLNNLGYQFLQENKNLEEALSMIQRAVAAEPSNSNYLDSLGWAYFKLDRLDEAERYLSEAVRVNERLATPYEHLGDVYMKRGQIKRAREAWQKALSLPEDEINQRTRLTNKLKR